MQEQANFRVDPRLASLLSETYRSSEQALKELVDNSWDADAENVWITLPDGISGTEIIVRDDGLGMTDKEVRQEYLAIARNRRSRRGDRTHLRNRPVKGRKGIGKFAGFVAANMMEVETRSHGKITRLRIGKQEVLKSSRDLEDIELPMSVEDCDSKEKGTTIILSDLNQKLSFPNPATLRQLLVLEYGRQRGIVICVNGERLVQEDLPGTMFTEVIKLPDGKEARLQFTLMQTTNKPRYAGIITRVEGKVVGKPGFFGLDERDDIPRKLLNRVVGEIEADDLADDVTSDWGAILQNSTAYQHVRDAVHNSVAEKLAQVFSDEVNLAKARLKKVVNRRIELMPEHRRSFAEKALDKVMRKFYGESEEKIETMVGLVLDAFDIDEYWAVCRRIENARRADVLTFAEALETFGLLDMAMMAEQARRRLRLLDDLDRLASDPATLEKEMHVALEKNLWLFGAEYSLMSSNKTLAKVIEDYTGNEFSGPRSKKRPDLLLAQNVLRNTLLIEFKRPSHMLNRDDEAQARKYRDDLTPGFGAMKILLVGGGVSPSISPHYDVADVSFLSYAGVISAARGQLDWLVIELTSS